MSDNFKRIKLELQPIDKDLHEANAHLFGDKDFADVIFEVGKDKKEFFGHKTALFAHSPVLANSFKENFARREMRDDRQYQVIEVPEMELNAFNAFMKFLYTGQLVIMPDIAMALLHAAKRYKIYDFETLVREYLQENLNIGTIFAFYREANLMKDDKMVEECWKWIDSNTDAFVRAQDFEKFDKTSLCAMLRRDTLTIREFELLRSVFHWAKANVPYCTKGNLRKALNEVLPLIRFPLMTFEEFGRFEDLSLFENYELIALIKYKCGGPNPTFSAIPRNPLASFIEKMNGELIVRRFQIISRNDFVFDDKWVGVCFNVDRNIELLGYGIYGSKFGMGNYSGQVLANNTPIILEMESNSVIHHVYFDEPRICHANSKSYHAAAIMLSGPPSYGGENGRENVVCQTSDGPVTFTFLNLQTQKHNYTVATGQVPELIFRILK